ncbi:hypothetical protein GF354_03300 [Candidatus Peregrinibacteria bacterium]|nr:hypothetical protein [Candidatus Peregrinibacteria bacterium]
MKNKLIALLTVCLFFLLNSGSVFSVTPRFGLRDLDRTGMINIDAAPGSRIIEEVILYNYDTELSIGLEMLFTHDTIPEDWIFYSSEIINMDLYSYKVIPVFIQVPEDTDSGSYSGKIVAKLKEFEGIENVKGGLTFSTAVGVKLNISVDENFEKFDDFDESEIPRLVEEVDLNQDNEGGVNIWIKGGVGFVFFILIVILIIFRLRK